MSDGIEAFLNSRIAQASLLEPAAIIALRPQRYDLDIEPLMFSSGEYTLGSGAACDFVLDFDGIAERHCRLVVSQKETVLHALSPLTWVNDGPVTEVSLRPGDEVALGPLEFIVEACEPSVEQRSYSPPDISDLLRELILSKTHRHDSAVPDIQMPSPEVQGAESSGGSSDHDQEFEIDAEIRFLEVQRSELQDQQADFDRRRRELHREIHELDQMRAKVDAAHASATEREIELARKEALLAESVLKLAEQQSEWEARGQSALDQTRQLETFERQRQELENQRAELQAYAAELESRTDAMFAEIQDLKAQSRPSSSVDEKQLELASQTELSERIETELASQNQKLQARLQELDRLQADLAADRSVVRQRQVELDRKEAEVNDSLRELATREAELLDQQAARLRQTHDAAHVQLEAHQLLEERAKLEAFSAELEQRSDTLFARLQALKIGLRRSQSQTEDSQQLVDLKNSADELDAKSRDIERQLAELHQLQKNLELAQTRVHEREEDVARKEAAIDQEMLDLADREAAFAQQASEIQRQTERLASLQAEIAADSQQLARQRDENKVAEDAAIAVRREQDRLAALAGTLDAQSSEIQIRLDHLHLKEQEISRTWAKLTDESVSIENSQAEITRRLRDLDAREKDLDQQLRHAKEVAAAAETSEKANVQNAASEERANRLIAQAMTERAALEAQRAEFAVLEQAVQFALTELQSDSATLQQIEVSLVEQEAILHAEIEVFQARAQVLETERERLDQYAATLAGWENELAEREEHLDQSLDQDDLLKQLEQAQQLLKREQRQIASANLELEAARTENTLRAQRLDARQREVEDLSRRLSFEREQLQQQLLELESREHEFHKSAAKLNPQKAKVPAKPDDEWDESWNEFSLEQVHVETVAPTADVVVTQEESKHVKPISSVFTWNSNGEFQLKATSKSVAESPAESNVSEHAEVECTSEVAVETPLTQEPSVPAIDSRQIRDDLASFREIAKRSARKSVATSRALKAQERNRTLLIGTIGFWVISLGIILWIALNGVPTVLSLLSAGAACGMSLVMMVLLFFSSQSIQKALQDTLAEESELTPREDVTADSP